MQYRTFGTNGPEISALGMGCMRLPADPETRTVDEDAAVAMIRWAIDQGVNYLDTAYGYHGGASEVVVGKALRDGYRDRAAVATKMPCWRVEEAADLDTVFAEQCQRLQVERIDFYLLHALNREWWPKMKGLGTLEWLQRQRDAGRIGRIGFSFHDQIAVFREIVDGFDWEFCQIQYNYLNEEYQAGTEGLRYAAAKGLPVIAMEPLLGGRLARLPEAVATALAETAPGVSAVELALNWLWDKPEVTVVLSGMSSQSQVQENVALADRSAPGMLGDAGRAVVAKAQAVFRDLTPVPCTECGYCMPCPQGVAIPRSFAHFNNAQVFGTVAAARRSYQRMQEEIRADRCVSCGECEPKCPQGIAIAEWLNQAHAFLSDSE